MIDVLSFLRVPGAPSSRPLEEVLEQVVIQYMVMSEAYATCRIKLAGLDMYPEVWHTL